MDVDFITYESMLAARESAKWALWGAIGVWVSGIATFLAVLTSLYIAMKRPNAFISGDVKMLTIFGNVYENQAIGVRVVNQSLHSVVLNSIEWGWGAKFSAQQLFRNDESDKLPIRIEHGEIVNYRIILSGNDNDWIHRFAKTLKENKVDIGKLKCLAVLSTGQRYSIKISKHVRDEIAKVMSDLD